MLQMLLIPSARDRFISIRPLSPIFRVSRDLALSPAILFLDEPSAGLDPITSAEIDELVLHINRATGTTLVIVTHEIASVFRLAQRVIFLDKGARGIVAEGDPRHLRQHSANPLVRRFLQSKTL